SSAWSMAARPASRYSLSGVIPLGERGRRRLQLAALVEDVDPALGLLEPGMAEARQLDAALVQLQGALEREVALLELPDDRLQLRDRRFEVLNRRIHTPRNRARRARALRAPDPPSAP